MKKNVIYPVNGCTTMDREPLPEGLKSFQFLLKVVQMLLCVCSEIHHLSYFWPSIN